MAAEIELLLLTTKPPPGPVSKVVLYTANSDYLQELKIYEVTYSGSPHLKMVIKDLAN